MLQQTLWLDVMVSIPQFDRNSLPTTLHTVDELPFVAWCPSAASSLSGRCLHIQRVGWGKTSIA